MGKWSVIQAEVVGRQRCCAGTQLSMNVCELVKLRSAVYGLHYWVSFSAILRAERGISFLCLCFTWVLFFFFFLLPIAVLICTVVSNIIFKRPGWKCNDPIKKKKKAKTVHWSKWPLLSTIQIKIICNSRIPC